MKESREFVALETECDLFHVRQPTEHSNDTTIRVPARRIQWAAAGGLPIIGGSSTHSGWHPNEGLPLYERLGRRPLRPNW